VAFLCGLICIVYPDTQPFNRIDRAIQIATAFGTVGAAIIALNLGLAASVRAAKESDDRAHLTAAGLAVPLSVALGDVALMIHLCNELVAQAAKGEEGENARRRAFSYLQQASIRPVFNVSSDTLSALSIVPNHAAARLHAGCSIMRDVLQRCEVSINHNQYAVMKAEHFWGLISQILGDVKKAEGYLLVAHYSIATIANEFAPVPSEEEIAFSRKNKPAIFHAD